MAKQQPKVTIKKVVTKTDTTKIPTPYKVKVRTADVKNNLKSSGEFPRLGDKGRVMMSDSTKAKVNYNDNVVGKAVEKRNMERLKEGKKPIQKQEVFGTKRLGYESTKGKTFKEAPLPLPKKK